MTKTETNRAAERTEDTDGGIGGLAAAGPATLGEGMAPAICLAPKCGQEIQPGAAVAVLLIGWWRGVTPDGEGSVTSIVEAAMHIGCSGRLDPAAVRSARRRVRVHKEGEARAAAEPEEARV